MKRCNLERAAEISRDLPVLQTVRAWLSNGEPSVTIEYHQEQRVLPTCMKHHLLNALNVEINKMEKEIETL